MLRIQKKQHEAVAEKLFIDRLEASLADALLDRRVSAVERERMPLRAMIEHGVAVARGYGQSTERDLTLFVLNMITINPEWHRQPRIHGILEDASLTPPDRREKLLTDVSDAEWEEAAKMTPREAYWVRALPPPP